MCPGHADGLSCVWAMSVHVHEFGLCKCICNSRAMPVYFRFFGPYHCFLRGCAMSMHLCVSGPGHCNVMCSGHVRVFSFPSGHVNLFSLIRDFECSVRAFHVSGPFPYAFLCLGQVGVLLLLPAMSVYCHVFGSRRCVFASPGHVSVFSLIRGFQIGSMLSCVRAMSVRYRVFGPRWCLPDPPAHADVVQHARAIPMHFHESGPCPCSFMCPGHVCVLSCVFRPCQGVSIFRAVSIYFHFSPSCQCIQVLEPSQCTCMCLGLANALPCVRAVSVYFHFSGPCECIFLFSGHVNAFSSACTISVHFRVFRPCQCISMTGGVIGRVYANQRRGG